MTYRHLFVLGGLCLLALSSQAQQKAARSTALAAAKFLTVNNGGSELKYHVVSNNDFVTLHFDQSGKVSIAGQEYDKAQLKMRFVPMEHRLMDEDSTSFFNKSAFEHMLVGLRRTLSTDHWNSIVLPFALTGKQVKEAFGEDTQLAILVGINADNEQIIDFQTVEFNDQETAIKANYHYLIIPSKAPDVAAGRYMTNFYSGTRVQGPLYLFPDVSMKRSATARFQDLPNANQENTVRIRGTYYAQIGASTSNKKVAPGAYALDEENGLLTMHADSLALKGFRSWIVDLKDEERMLNISIDGVELSDGIDHIYARESINQSGIFDLSGRQLNARTRKGIYIINGKKIVIP